MSDPRLGAGGGIDPKGNPTPRLLSHDGLTGLIARKAGSICFPSHTARTCMSILTPAIEQRSSMGVVLPEPGMPWMIIAIVRSNLLMWRKFLPRSLYVSTWRVSFLAPTVSATNRRKLLYIPTRRIT